MPRATAVIGGNETRTHEAGARGAGGVAPFEWTDSISLSVSLVLFLLVDYIGFERSAVCRDQRQIRDFFGAPEKSGCIRSPWGGFREGGRYLGIPQNRSVRVIHAHGLAPLASTRAAG